MNQEVVSFVLRFIREESDDQSARWRGVIKHVQSDNTADFAHFRDALQFMQAHVDDAIRKAFSSQDAESATPEALIAETARLWGEMAPRYADLMLQSMEIMLEQGRRMGETVAENLAQWNQPPQDLPPQPQQMLDVIERLANQVESLSSKVDALEARLRHDQ